MSELSPGVLHLDGMYTSVNGTELYFDVDGSQLRVDNTALTACPTVIALHGGPGFDQGYLRPGLAALHDFAQVVFVDLRGQGRSAKVAVETCTLEQMADDVLTLAVRLGIERPYLFGHSAGGFVALHAALRGPDQISGLILCNTAATLVPEPEAGSPSLVERAGAEAAAVAGRVFSGDVTPETGQAFARVVAPYYAGPRHTGVPGKLFPLSPPTTDVMQYFFGELAANYDVRPRLGEIDLPTLVIAGGYDWVCPPAAARTIAAGIPNARLVEFHEAGHFTMSEEPDAFVDAVRTFVHG